MRVTFDDSAYIVHRQTSADTVGCNTRSLWDTMHRLRKDLTSATNLEVIHSMSSHRRDFLRVVAGVFASGAVHSCLDIFDSSENCSEADFIMTNLQRKFSLPHPLYEASSQINECNLSQVTRRYLKALRNYGAYLVDGSSAFSFCAEDCRTGNLNLSLDGFNTLCGRAVSAPLPDGKSQWQVLVETLNAEFWAIPFALRKDGGLVSNFDFVADAIPPAGFEPVCGPAEINDL